MRIATKSENREKIGESRENRRIATKSENRDKIGESQENRRIATNLRISTKSENQRTMGSLVFGSFLARPVWLAAVAEERVANIYLTHPDLPKSGVRNGILVGG